MPRWAAQRGINRSAPAMFVGISWPHKIPVIQPSSGSSRRLKVIKLAPVCSVGVPWLHALGRGSCRHLLHAWLRQDLKLRRAVWTPLQPLIGPLWSAGPQRVQKGVGAGAVQSTDLRAQAARRVADLPWRCNASALRRSARHAPGQMEQRSPSSSNRPCHVGNLRPPRPLEGLICLHPDLFQDTVLLVA